MSEFLFQPNAVVHLTNVIHSNNNIFNKCNTLSLFFCNWIFSQGWNDRGSVWTRSVEIMQQYLCSSNHSIVLVALYHIFFLNSWVWSPGEDLWQWETSAVKWCLSTQGDQELILTLFIMQGYNHLTLLITTGRETVRYWHFFYCFCSEYSFCS